MEDGQNIPATLADNRTQICRNHSGDVFNKATACNMGNPFDLIFFYKGENGFDVDACRRKNFFAQTLSEPVIILIELMLMGCNNLANQ